MSQQAFYLAQCKECKRKILIERAFDGIENTTNIVIVCADCIPGGKCHDDFRSALPDVAKEIDEWMKS